MPKYTRADYELLAAMQYARRKRALPPPMQAIFKRGDSFALETLSLPEVNNAPAKRG